MKPLNPRQQKFIEAFLRGMPAGRAYEAAGYCARGDAADALAARLIRNAKVSEAIAAVREEMRLAAKASREQLIDFLSDVIFTPIGQLDPTSPLIQEHVTREIGEMTTETRIKMVSKMDAVKQLVAMMGWNAPEEVKHTGAIHVVIGGDADA